MQIHNLKRIHPRKKTTQIGRGGKRGKTSGRGGKGQTARAGNRPRPMLRDIIKRIPKLRGYRFKSFQERAVPINLSRIGSVFSKGGKVNPTTLLSHNLIRMTGGVLPRVKILGTAELKEKLTVSNCAVSASARQAIEKAGGVIR